MARHNWAGQQTLRLEFDADKVRAAMDEGVMGFQVVAFSPDGKVLATGGIDRDVPLWSFERLLTPPVNELSTHVECSAYMPFHKQGREFPVFERSGVKFGVIICSDGGTSSRRASSR